VKEYNGDDVGISVLLRISFVGFSLLWWYCCGIGNQCWCMGMIFYFHCSFEKRNAMLTL